MAANFQLVLDTTGPQGVGGKLNGDATYTNVRGVTLAPTTTDPDTTGYQIKVWGDVDPAADPNIQPTEAASSWMTLTAAIAVTLATGDGTKNVTWRLRDDVWNTSSTATDQIVLDTTVPVVTVSAGPDVAKVSKVAGKDTANFTWSSDSDYQAYVVKVVPNGSSDHNAGTAVPTTAGSTNMSGVGGTAGTAVTSAIHGADLEAASAGDGAKTVKVFVQDLAGNWST